MSKSKVGLVISTHLFGVLLCGQDLTTAWDNYISIDTELQKAHATERRLEDAQNTLQKEIRFLQEGQSWYNGWINEMRLARKSRTYVELSDSLQGVREQISGLRTDRDAAFLSLKKAYRDRVLEPGEGEDLSSMDRARAISLGQLIMARSDRTADFPDYSAVVTSHYEDERIRELVLNDLRSVLESKVVLIDSLLTERKAERELVHRLGKFHRDLGLQMESDRDLGSKGLTRSRGGSYSPESDAETGYLTTDFAAGPEEQKSIRSSVEGPTIESQVSQDSRMDSPFESSSIERDIKFLDTRHHQYNQLLRQIEQELAH